jgi:SAM-dependent methyltransferase
MVRDLIAATDRPTILELGARRVGVDQGLREMLGISGQEHTYIGADLYAAPGVDVVGDFHQLSRLMKRRSVDFVVSKSVFEHLAIPWKVILEINAILREGGYLFINTEQTFPLHELPWDFFRFSDRAWAAMANAATGYEIVATELNAPCRVVPEVPIDGWSGDHAAFINSNLLARKIGGYDRRRVRWDLPTSEVAAGIYPPPPSGT